MSGMRKVICIRWHNYHSIKKFFRS